MATQAAYKRLVREFKDMSASPPHLITAKPLDSNILEWHFLFNGPPDTHYKGGVYWGKLMFPAEYPYKPPNIRMFTPSGRFTPGHRICLSYSDFHPELWNPGWSVATILNGLLSFMSSNEGGAGTEQCTNPIRHSYAQGSMQWNRRQPQFQELWPEFCTPGDSSIPQLGTPLPPEHTETLTLPCPGILRHRRQPNRAALSTCSTQISAQSSLTDSSQSKWHNVPTWMFVACSLWICLFFYRLSARLLGSV